MHSKRDQVQAHTFMVGRLVSALVRGEPDLPVTPARRTPVGVVIGATLAALAVGTLVVLSFIIPGGATGWRKPGVLIVEKPTGNRYVLLDGRLRPVLNYASARLLLGPRLSISSVPAKTLAKVPHGAPVGILGGPDALPGAGAAAASPWLVCATSVPVSRAGRRPGLAAVIGSGIAARPLADRQAVLVRGENGGMYLAWRGTRLRLSAGWVQRVLGFADDAAVPVRDSWLDALPAGPDIGSPPVEHRGDPGPELDGKPTFIGQLFAVRPEGGQQPRYYLLTSDGLLPTTATAATLALGDPGSAQSYDSQPPQARELSPAALAAATVLPQSDWARRLPPLPPALVTTGGDQVPCVRVVAGAGGSTAAVVTIPATVLSGSAVDGAARTRDARSADQVDVRPGSGLLARTAPAPGVPGAGLYLVTEDGAKYPVAGPAAAEALGYRPAGAVPQPADLLALLPTGPVLDRIGAGGGARGP